jgi:hypothetical protein
MPWKIIEAEYDPADKTTLHDDELIAIERALSEAMGHPQNENNPRWRAREKVRPLATRCTGRGDPIEVLPPGARASPVWASYPQDPSAPAPPAPPAAADRRRR